MTRAVPAEPETAARALNCASLDSHCITCGDDGVAMQVLRVDAIRQLALCMDEAGVRSSVEIALVEPVNAGDELLVHAGTAIATLSAAGPGVPR